MDENTPNSEPTDARPQVGGTVLDDHDRPDQTAAMNAAPPPTAWYDVPVARSATDSKVGGVIAGVCRAHGFDVGSTRIAFAVVALVLPVLVFVYLAAWVLLPTEPAPAVSPRQLVTERQRRPLLIAFGAVLAAVLIGSVGSWWWLGDFPWGLGLVAGGVLLWLLSARRNPPAPKPPTPEPSMTMSSGTAGTGDRWPTTTAMSTVVASEPPAPATGTVVGATVPFGAVDTPPTPAHGLPTTGRRARERSRRRVRARSRRRVPIASITLVALAVIAAFLQLGENLDWWNIEVGAAVMTGLAVMVLATIVSAVVNRSLALIAITLLLTFALTGFAVADPTLDGPIGDRAIRLAPGSDTGIQWQQGIGRLRIDLRDLEFTEGADLTTITASVGIGQLEVVVHQDVTIDVNGSVNVGQILLYNEQVASGVRVQHRVVVPAADQPAAGTVRLDLEVGVGEITVIRTDADR
jgi:phage shock protein PspC (stress-responsive transcriptional regulator)